MSQIVRGPERIRRALLGGYPLVYVRSWEEARVERAITGVGAKYEKPVPFASWSCVDGIRSPSGEAWPDTADPVKALDAILRFEGPGFFLMKDLPAHFERPEVVRRLRDAYRQLKGKGRHIFLVSPRLLLPQDLKKEIYVLDYDLPGDDEIAYVLTHLGKRFLGEPGFVDADLRRLGSAVKGLTLDEIEHVLSKVLGRRPVFDDDALREILAEKEQASRKEGVLEFISPRVSMEDVGGLENLKDWLTKRKNLFTRESVDAGMPVPKGILLMGMSGCGKSLSVKVISSFWNLPLFRLDMNLVFGTDSPEYAFHNALQTVEGMAPALLWIDEIEMAITGGSGTSTGGDGSLGRIFSTFLTWMQEKDALVFVAATANRIHLLPAEIIRKGRFDQVFFVDLPNEEERKQIFAVHLRRHKVNLDKFDVVFLAKATKGWNGAEIEAAVNSSAIEAFASRRALVEDDVSRAVSRAVPLSRTMEEQMKAIKSWAHDRALSASKS
ncbi:MAG: AAA family ATPase [Acidobacteria bacterium]|nr:AAA family ATPase [Acidobacteriota bacterium]